MNICTWLRWKGARNQRENPELVKKVFTENEVPYSCLRNTQPVGPDGKLVSPECCGEHRICFEKFGGKKAQS